MSAFRFPEISERSEQICVEIARELERFFKEIEGRKVAISFSGGLDSSILAFLGAKYCLPTLYSVGTPGSKDLKNARESKEEIEKALGKEIRSVEILLDEEKVLRALKGMKALGARDPLLLSFEIPQYLVLLYSEERELISGQGADELFLGYAKYLEDPSRWEKDLQKLLKEVVPFEDRMAGVLGKEILRPYLSEKIVERAKEIPISERIFAGIRKLALRKVAEILGVPEKIVRREKKAAQYGSGALKLMRKLAKERGMAIRDLIEAIRDDNNG